MRPNRNRDDFELPNEAEIEAALQDALRRPLDDLLALDEFIEKAGAVRPPSLEITGSGLEPPESLPFVLPIPVEPENGEGESRAIPRAA